MRTVLVVGACVLMLTVSETLARPRGGRAPRGGGRTAPNSLPTNRLSPSISNLPQLAPRAGAANAPAPTGRSLQNFDPSRLQQQPRQTQEQRAGQIQPRAQSFHSMYSGGPQPFSPAWYTAHPNAWKLTHPHADAWAVASWAAITTWLGLSAIVPGTTSYESVVIYDETGPTEQNVDDASQLAANRTDQPGQDDQWLSLGVYSVGPEDQQETTAVVQLAVHPDGTLRGLYYDLVSASTKNVQGAVNTTTQRVAWTVGEDGRIVFETRLYDLTDEIAIVWLHFPNGDSRRWEMVRLANESATQP